MTDRNADIHDKLMALAKRRGFVQPSYEIYGGVAGFYDYGPLGATLKQNVQNVWRELFVLGEGMAEIECPNLSPEQVFRASGHLEKFADTVVECPACGAGNRGDHLVRNEWKRLVEAATPVLAKHGLEHAAKGLEHHVETVRSSADKDPSPANLRALLDGTHAAWKPDHHAAPGKGELHWGHVGKEAGASEGVTISAGPHGIAISKGGKALHQGTVNCPACTKPLDVANAKINAFNLMFKTQIGPGTGRAGYFRPETAQGMFMDFDWLYRHFREKLPFGAVQLGRAYRNEISPRQAMLRLREFNQMEAEVFFDPANKTWPRYHELEGRELNLLRAGTEEPTKWRMGDAVAKGVIANGALGYFLALTDVFLERAGIRKDIVRFRQHEPTEKAHYSTDTWDAEFLSPRFGWVEIVGIADRTDYDLKAHERVSGQSLKALRRYETPLEVEVNKVVPVSAKLGPLFKGKAAKVSEALQKLHPDHVENVTDLEVDVDGETITVPAGCFRIERGTERREGEAFTPHVVEPSFGVDRILYAVLESSMHEGEEWITLRLPPKVAPVKCGVFPLMPRDGLDGIAEEIDRELRRAGVLTQYDDSGSIGRRYARQDEIGTPYCVTVDYDTKTDATVTIRERDTGAQKRVPRAGLAAVVAELVRGERAFADVVGRAVG